MIKSVTINGIEYQVQEGLSITDNASEELDSCTFQIINSEPIDLEPMQEVKILLNNNETISTMINTWVDSPATFDSNLKNYIINCISESKKLERIQLPNMTITQPFGVPKRMYKKYVNQLYEMYIVKQYPELRIGSALNIILNGKQAVEEQFTTPNAKEYLNRILEKENALVRVNNNIILPFDLTRKGNPIDESKLFFKTSSQAIEDYYNSIRMDVQGVQSENPTIYKELVGVRADGEAVLTTENGAVLLAHNIDKLESVICYVHCQYLVGGEVLNKEGTLGFRLYGGQYNYIKEKQEYDLLEVSNALDIKDVAYKRMNLYFSRGSNKIEGLNYNETAWFSGIKGIFPAIINIIVKIGSDNGIGVITQDLDFRDFKFQVTYSALDDVSFQKDKIAAHNSQIRDNQNTSFIDLDKLANYEQEKLNRLGNEIMPITARYTSLDDVPQLMDYIGNFILAKREIVFHRDYIDFKGTLCKDYIQKNIYYGVSSKRRTYSLALGSESVTRKELTKYNYKFSYSDKADGDKKLTRYLLGTYASNNYIGEAPNGLPSNERAFKPIKLALGKSKFSDNNSVFYKLEPDIRKAGKSFTINFKFYDNKNIGMRFGDIKEITGGYSQQYVSYTDKNAELESIKIQLYDDKAILNDDYIRGELKPKDSSDPIRFIDTDGKEWKKGTPNIEQKIFRDVKSSREYYYVSLTDEFLLCIERELRGVDRYPAFAIGSEDYDFCIFDETLMRYKDGREILNETLQFNFDGDDGIFITDKGIEYFNIFTPQRNEDSLPYIVPKLKVYISTTTIYNKYNCNNLVGNSVDASELLQVDYSDYLEFLNNKVLFNRLMLYNKGIDMSNVLSWALADENGKVYIAVNKRESDATIPTTIYLNKED